MGDEATTTVQTEGDATDTILTGDAGAADGDAGASSDEGGANNSDGDATTSSDDTGNSDEGQGEGDAGADGSDVVPDTYADFTLPEGMELDETVLAEATPMFKELGLTQDQSQKVVDFYAKQVQASSQTQIDNFNQLMSDWRDQSKNDGEFGGDKFEENVKIARSAVDKYGTPELQQLLTEHGVGNHPEVVRFMVRVGQTLQEDVPGSSGTVSKPGADRVDILYPNSKKQT